jgi:hypothetical protein
MEKKKKIKHRHTYGNQSRNKALGRLKRRLEDNTNWLLNKQESIDWIDLAQDWNRWLGYCKRGNESSGYAKCLEFLTR